MAIPSTQLSTWSNPGAVTAAQQTHLSIRQALVAPSSPVALRDPDVFLSGSYKNHTNVRADSDVDVVAQLNESWIADTTGLNVAEKSLYDRWASTATYNFQAYRQDVLTALQNYYTLPIDLVSLILGTPVVVSRNKCIRVNKASSSRLHADVLPCLQYRRYRRFVSPQRQSYVEGVVFFAQSGEQIRNFPKLHYDNGVTKNDENHTRGLYRPVVRMFKNARSAAQERGLLAKEHSVSYFVECLLYNVPDSLFNEDPKASFVGIMNWLTRNLSNTFVCQNGQESLFGTRPEQWSLEKARALIASLARLWKEW